MGVLRFLWGYVLPTWGVLSLACLGFAGWLLFSSRYAEDFGFSFEDEYDLEDRFEFLDEARVPSPDGKVEAVFVYAKDGEFERHTMTLLQPGEELNAMSFIRDEGIDFEFRQPNPTVWQPLLNNGPLQVEWKSASLLEIQYCDVLLRASNSLSMTVDVNMVRRPDCATVHPSPHNWDQDINLVWDREVEW